MLTSGKRALLRSYDTEREGDSHWKTHLITGERDEVWIKVATRLSILASEVCKY